MILGSLAAVSFSVSTVFRFSMCFKTCIFDEDRFLHHSLSLIQVSAKPKQKHASTAVVHAIIMKVPISSFASGKIRSREWVTLTIKATKSMYISIIFITCLLKGYPVSIQINYQACIKPTAPSWPSVYSPSKVSTSTKRPRRNKNTNV